MRIRLLVSRAGVDFAHSAGDEIDVPDAEARRMIEAQQAAPVRSVRKEKAVPKKAAEHANVDPS